MTKKGSKKTTTKPANDQTAAKPKQLKLDAEGMSRKKIAEVDKAAEAYRKARDVRMQHTKTEKEKKTLLLEVAKKHGIKVYVYEDEDGEEFTVEYKAEEKENVKVNKRADDGDDE